MLEVAHSELARAPDIDRAQEEDEHGHPLSRAYEEDVGDGGVGRDPSRR